MQMFTLQGVQKDTVPFILSLFHHQIKCHFNTSQQAGHVFECKLASAGHRLIQYSCIIFKKQSRFFLFMAFNPLIVVSPHLLLYATIQMVHLQSTFAWLILQHGRSAGETHYTVCVCLCGDLCACLCVYMDMDMISLFFEISLSTNMLANTKQCVVYSR